MSLSPAPLSFVAGTRLAKREGSTLVGSLLGSLAVVLLVLVPTLGAHAENISLDFDSPGVLPSAESSIVYVSDFPVASPIPESEAFGVANGVLTQAQAEVDGRGFYTSPDATLSGGSFDPSSTLVMETRLQIDSIDAAQGVFLEALDGVHGYRIAFDAAGLVILHRVGGTETESSVAADTSTFHVYRLESPADSGSFEVLVDGVSVFAGDAVLRPGLNGAAFGNGVEGIGGAKAVWDSVRIQQVGFVLSVSPDVSLDLGAGGVADDEDAVADNQLGIALLEDLGTLPSNSDVVALDLEPTGDRLIAFDVTTLLPGDVVARPGDVVRYDGSSHVIVFDAAAAGLPAGVVTDAASPFGQELLLSFDTTVDLGGGLVAMDEDLVVWDGASFRLVFDGSANGLSTLLDVDGAQALGHGRFFVSFDTAGSVAGIPFADEDVLLFDGAAWSLAVDSSRLDAAWEAADLDGLTTVPEPAGAMLIAVGIASLLLRARSRRRAVGSVLGALAVLTFAGVVVVPRPAHASDGVIEISHVCATQTGCFAGDTPGYPVRIDGSAGKSYRLTSDLILPDTSTAGVQVTASGVHIDLGGFEIVSTGCQGATDDCPLAGCLQAAHGIGSPFSTGPSDLVVTNGIISGAGGSGIDAGPRARISGVTARWNGCRGIEAGDASILSGNTAYKNLQYGLQAPTSIFESNVARENGFSGIDAGNDSTLVGNLSEGNAQHGYVPGSGCVIEGNSASSNGESGFIVSSRSIVRNNTARSNTLDGIAVAENSLVEGNVVSSNGDDGIVLTGSGSSAIDNVVSENSGDGIVATFGGLSQIRGNTVNENAGVGIVMNAPSLVDAIFSNNVVLDNVGGTTIGGNNAGGNTCHVPGNPTTACP